MGKEKEHLEQKNRADYNNKENQYNRKHELSKEEIEAMRENDKEENNS